MNKNNLVERVSKRNGLPQTICKLEHLINPLHIYCRLNERGISKQKALLTIKLYELIGYNPLIKSVEYLRRNYKPIEI